MPDGTPALNQGDDIAGTVHAVGEGVTEFRVGDRVAGTIPAIQSASVFDNIISWF